MERSEVSKNVVKWIEYHSNRLSNIIRRYIDQMKFAAYMAVWFIFSIFYWFYFVSLYVGLCVLYASV